MHNSLKSSPTTALVAVLVGLLCQPVEPVSAGDSASPAASAKKKLYIPGKVTRVPEDNDYDDNDSDFSFQRMVEGDNIAIFWHKEYGEEPMTNPDKQKRFNVHKMLSECERFYDCYVDELEVVKKGQSISDQYKLLVYVFGGSEGTAFGGGIEDKVGALWTPAVRVNREPYGVLAHEMGHCFQFMSRVDSGTGAHGAIVEMSAQYMLWQVYPEWMTFENYHLVDFLKQTHHAFMHPINMYHSPYVLEYWSHKHGKTFYGDLNRATQQGEDVVATYKRMNHLDQQQFNDEMFDAARRFITWDMERIEKVARPYANQHQCTLSKVDDGWYRIPPELCPQNYGYNGIRLRVPAEGTGIQVQFKGIAGADGYSSVAVDKAGWRYGLLAHLKDNTRVYGDVSRSAEGSAVFTVPANTEYLWLVVMGAPTVHWPVDGMRRASRGDHSSPDEQWPYQVKLVGTTFHESVIE